MEAHATIQIQAPPEKVYAMVSDVTRVGEWSPECRKAEWVEGDGPEVGARFKGHNKQNWLIQWSRPATVKVADPGKEFTFETGKPGKEETRWTYRLAPSSEGTELTESFEALRYGRFAKLFARPEKRTAVLAANIRQTLERIKQAAEGSA